MKKLRNENRPGFKKTKMGWIPEGWKCVSLSSIAKVQTGVAKSSKKTFSNPKQYPYLRVANVQDGHLLLNDIKKLSIEESDFERYALRFNDVLFTEGGDFDKLGRGTIWREEIPNCIHQNHIFVVRTNSKSLLPYFLSAMASGPIGKRYFLLCSKQSTNLASINSSQLKAFPIPLPPLPEQKRIAEILSAWDRAIEQTGKLIDVKQRLKKGLMQQLLTGRMRFPEFGKPIKKQGDLPDGWQEMRLGEIFKEVKRPVRWDDSERYKLISVRRRSEGLFMREPLFGYQIATKNLFIAKEEDFLISKMQITHGASGIVISEFDGMKISGSYIALRAKNNNSLDINYFDWLSKTRQMYHNAFISSYGVHIEKMTFNLKLYLKTIIKLPSRKEQTHITAVLSILNREIELLKRKQEKLKEQKKGMMQKLLTGEVRVKS